MAGVLGQLLRNVHAGEAKLFCAQSALASLPKTIEVLSTDFPPGGPIPRVSAGLGVGSNISPEINWRGVPGDARELVLIVEDPDVPLLRPFVHLLAYGIEPSRSGFMTGALAGGSDGVLFGRNTGGRQGYAGPRALVGHGPHRYVFQLYALGQPSGLQSGKTMAQLRSAVKAGGLAWGSLTGTFERPSRP